jgi:tetratricopeptide (TPR) repeat protein
VKYKWQITDKSSSHRKGIIKWLRTHLGRHLHRSRTKQQSPEQKAVASEILKKGKRQKDVREVSYRQTTSRRLWLFRFIAAIFIPTFLILVLEFGLRLTGYGYQAKAIIDCQVKGQKAYCDNSKFGWLFFPPNIAREFIPFVIPSQKPENIYRIFVFGASAAQGVPDSAYSFSRILEIILSEEYPGVNFEVVNTAMTAINSHVVVKIAKDCTQYEPDLFVVYMGSNEVIGPYGAGTVFAPLSEHLSLIHMGIAFRQTRLGQLLTSLMKTFKTDDTLQVWGGIGMFLDRQVSADDESLQVVYRNFKKNLESIVNIADKRKTAVILATVGSNLKDCPPFASLHRRSITEEFIDDFNELYEEGIEYERADRFTQAMEKYLDAVEIDGQFAELQFRLGRCHFYLDQYEQARLRYIRARELDTIRLRADTRINEIIREVSQNKNFSNVFLADFVNALEKHSPHYIAGDELFYEHVHLNFTGNYILAKCVFKQIKNALPNGLKSKKSAGADIIDENTCRQYLGFSDWDRYTIMRKLLDNYIVHPPFTNQLYHDEQVESLEQQILSLKDSLSEQALLQTASDYQRAIERRPTDWMIHWKYAEFLTDGLKDYRMAVAEYEKTLELVPHYYMAHVMLGTIWGRSGNYDEAMKHFNEAIKIKPFYAPAYYDIGLLYQKRKVFREAEKYYKTALRLNPEHYPSYTNLGALLADQGKIDEAVKVCQKGLEFFPDSPDLHYNVGCLLNRIGQKYEAVKEFRIVLKLDPEHSLAKRDLEMILKESE